eukprot:3211463-Heterocapsa_arctica.AAC.1
MRLSNTKIRFETINLRALKEKSTASAPSSGSASPAPRLVKASPGSVLTCMCPGVRIYDNC